MDMRQPQKIRDILDYMIRIGYLRNEEEIELVGDYSREVLQLELVELEQLEFGFRCGLDQQIT